MSKWRPCDEADIPEGHAFAETRDLHPADGTLRSYGFTIHSRAKGRQPVWIRKGVLYTQTEAEKFVCYEQRRKLDTCL